MTREEIIKSALKFLVLKQTEQGSWGFSDRNDNEISWDEIIKWIDQPACGDCISRQEAIRIAEQGQIQGYVWQFKKLCTLPSVESERKTGKWIRDKFWSVGIGMGEQYGYFYKCSECGKEVKGGYTECTDRFCKSCGAKMEVN